MNRTLPLSVAIAALTATAAFSSAALTPYPALDLTYSAPGSTEIRSSSAIIPLDALTGVFVDPDSGSPVAASTRYYGGIIRHTLNDGMSGWGGEFLLQFLRSNGQSAIDIGKRGGSDNMTFGASNVTTFNAGPTGVDLPFVIKLSDANWNLQSLSLFIGANALAAAEGTPDYTANDAFLDLSAPNSLASMKVIFNAEGWATQTSSASLSGVFSSTEWSPVVIPEPAMMGLLAPLGAMLLRRR